MNTERLHRFYFGRAEEAGAYIKHIALDSVPSNVLKAELARLWVQNDYERNLEDELLFLERLNCKLPDALPVCAEVITLRLHYGILRDELPHLQSAIFKDQSQGADASGPGQAFLQDMGGADAARAAAGTSSSSSSSSTTSAMPMRPFSPAEAAKRLEDGLIAGERMIDEAGSDLFTRTLAHTIATLQNLLTSTAGKLGPVSLFFAAMRWPILGFYFVARGLTHQCRAQRGHSRARCGHCRAAVHVGAARAGQRRQHARHAGHDRLGLALNEDKISRRRPPAPNKRAQRRSWNRYKSVTHVPDRSVKHLANQLHVLPSSSSPAFLRSSGVMASRNLTSAWNVRNHGSANAGIFDGSGKATMRTAPR